MQPGGRPARVVTVTTIARPAYAGGRSETPDAVPDPHHPPAFDEVYAAHYANLVAALATLPDNYRRAVVLHHLADLPVAEIASREGGPEGTVKSWLHRGRAALAAQLDQAGEACRD